MQPPQRLGVRLQRALIVDAVEVGGDVQGGPSSFKEEPKDNGDAWQKPNKDAKDCKDNKDKKLPNFVTILGLLSLPSLLSFPS
jgi:hypothetical protein